MNTKGTLFMYLKLFECSKSLAYYCGGFSVFMHDYLLCCSVLLLVNGLFFIINSFHNSLS